ncbi:MAG: DUF2950 domain-containing protein [Planctomycetota bacterium]|nr:DUF2950 domain-containing protein [Planctomycetota bacterium]
MNVRHRTGPGALCVLALLLTPGFARAGDAAAEKLLPADTVLALVLPDLGAARDAASKTKLGEMYAQPEMQAFLKPIMDELRKQYAVQTDRVPMLPALADLDSGLFSGEVALGIYPRPGQPIPAGLLATIKPRDVEAFKRLIPPPFAEQLLAGTPMPLGPPQAAPSVVFARDRLILAFPAEDLETILRRAGDAAPAPDTLAASAAFKGLREPLGAAAGWFYASPKGLLNLAFTATPLAADRDAKQVRQVLGALGVEGWTGLGVALGFGERGPELRACIQMEKAGEGLCALTAAPESVGAEGFRIAEKNAPYVCVSHFHCDRVLPLLRACLAAASPDFGDAFDGVLGMVNNTLGFDLQADLLANLGSEVVTAQTEIDTGTPLSLTPGMVMSMPVKNAAKVEECLTKFGQALENLPYEALRHLKLKPLQHKQHTLRYVSGMVFAGPGAFALVDNRLIVGTTINALRRGLDQLERKETVLEHADFQATVARLSGKPFDPARLPACFAYAIDQGRGTGSLLLTGLGVTALAGPVAGLAELPGGPPKNPGAPAPAADLAANEAAAIAACMTYAEAQDIYRRTDYDGDGVLEYAQAFKGQHSLYEFTAGQGDLTLIDKAMADAEGPPAAGGAAKAGYRFRVLKGQGEHAPGGARSYVVNGNMTVGYALLAYPAEYGKTGKRSFVINNTGTVHGKDLGDQTAELAAKLDAYDPDQAWEAVEDLGGMQEMERLDPFDPFARNPSLKVAMEILQSIDLGLWPDEGFFRKYNRPTGAIAIPHGNGYLWHSELPMPGPAHRGDVSVLTVTAVTAIVAAIAIPNLLRSRMAANESAAIAACKTYAEAQDIFRRTDYDNDGILEYAQGITGAHSLYEIQAGQGDLTLVDGAFARASADAGFVAPKAGYYFKVLKGQGPDAPGGRKSYVINGNMTIGYAIVAWPATYDNSGRNTFLINNTGTVYQKDMGHETAQIVQDMTEYNPDQTWVVAE